MGNDLLSCLKPFAMPKAVAGRDLNTDFGNDTRRRRSPSPRGWSKRSADEKRARSSSRAVRDRSADVTTRVEESVFPKAVKKPFLPSEKAISIPEAYKSPINSAALLRLLPEEARVDRLLSPKMGLAAIVLVCLLS